MRPCRLFVHLIVLCTLAIPAFPQQDLGTVTGRVTDPSGALITGAALTLTNQETGAKIRTPTNDSGNYAFRSLPYGSYEMSAEAKGFRKLIR